MTNSHSDRNLLVYQKLQGKPILHQVLEQVVYQFVYRYDQKSPARIKASRLLEFKVFKKIQKIFPILKVFYEELKEKGNFSVSPVMVAQNLLWEWIKTLSIEGQPHFMWETSETINYLVVARIE